jgi:hypothetical protein
MTMLNQGQVEFLKRYEQIWTDIKQAIVTWASSLTGYPM